MEQTTTIRATKTLHNRGQCFTKGKTYEVKGIIHVTASLMEKSTTNDLGELHIIGSFWRHFVIVKP